MILKIKSWCEGIIIAIIISIIIEMLVPEGKNKKYVKVVVGIYIMFVVLNPILELLNYDFVNEFSNNFNLRTEEVYSNLDDNIKDVYIVGIQEDMKKNIEELGYIVKDIKVSVDINYENIEKVELKIQKDVEDININPVIIGDNNINATDKNEKYIDVVNFLKEKYLIEESNIYFV